MGDRIKDLEERRCGTMTGTHVVGECPELEGHRPAVDGWREAYRGRARNRTHLMNSSFNDVFHFLLLENSYVLLRKTVRGRHTLT